MSSENIIHIDIIISGSVQGVGFRYSARNIAISLGIKGSVKNLNNGDVFIEAEGNINQLSKYIEWCKSGPTYSKVENVDTIKRTVKNYVQFNIVR